MNAKQCYLATIALWALLCAAHFVVRTHWLLAGPRDGDVYAYSWSFQAGMFLIFRFPFWCAALAATLLGEAWGFSRHRANRKAEPSGLSQ